MKSNRQCLRNLRLVGKPSEQPIFSPKVTSYVNHKKKFHKKTWGLGRKITGPIDPGHLNLPILLDFINCRILV